ncbi:hypothetical protein [Segatella sp.]
MKKILFLHGSEAHRELQNHARTEGIPADIEDKIKEKYRKGE